MPEDFTAFVSYSHDDDDYDDGAIMQLAQRLERALRAFTGRSDIAVFFDRRTIEWGDAWRARIDTGIGTSLALIAVVTPNYLGSDECRAEFEAFRKAGASRLFLPLYYIDVDDLEARDDPLAKEVRAQQYEDWRELRTTGPTSQEVRKAIEDLAMRIRDLLRQSSTVNANETLSPISDPSRAFRAHAAGEDEGDWLDYLIAGRAAFHEEKYGLARALLLGALESSDAPELIYELAMVDWYDGALEDAERGFQMALDSGIARAEVLFGLGQIRIERGAYEQGVADLTEVIDRQGDTTEGAWARSSRAFGLGGLRRFDEALEELRVAERVTPNNAYLHFNRARVLDMSGDHPAAKSSYVRSLVCAGPPLNRLKRRFAQNRLQELGGVQ